MLHQRSVLTRLAIINILNFYQLTIKQYIMLTYLQYFLLVLILVSMCELLYL